MVDLEQPLTGNFGRGTDRPVLADCRRILGDPIRQRTTVADGRRFGRLRVSQPGPGYVHFSRDLPPAFYAQLTAEARTRGDVSRWVRLRARNEALDATIYAIFASHALGLHTYTERMWQRLSAKVVPQHAPESAPAPPPQAPKPRPWHAQPPRRASWISKW